jgi:hypothetical protein
MVLDLVSVAVRENLWPLLKPAEKRREIRPLPQRLKPRPTQRWKRCSTQKHFLRACDDVGILHIRIGLADLVVLNQFQQDAPGARGVHEHITMPARAYFDFFRYQADAVTL